MRKASRRITWIIARAVFGISILIRPVPLQASVVTIDFSGTFDQAITEGANSIPVGTQFTGVFSYDLPQIGTVTPFGGGTQSVFTFASLTITVAGQNVTETPGQLGLYNDVIPPAGPGVPPGDSLFTFVPGIPNNTPGPSAGSINGITPNFIYLAFSDSTGTAFTGSTLPGSLNLSSFDSLLLGINTGPLGAGNTDTVEPITVAVPEPSSLVLFFTCLIGWSATAKAKRLRFLRWPGLYRG